MHDALFSLCRTKQAAGTAKHGFTLDPLNRRSTDRTGHRHLELSGFSLSAFQHHAGNFRNHVTGTSDHDPVTGTHILAANFIQVVQGRIADCYTADKDRFQPRYRVSAPVRPTWMSISSRRVTSSCAGNFCAMAQRGARLTKPSVSC